MATKRKETEINLQTEAERLSIINAELNVLDKTLNFSTTEKLNDYHGSDLITETYYVSGDRVWRFAEEPAVINDGQVHSVRRITWDESPTYAGFDLITIKRENKLYDVIVLDDEYEEYDSVEQLHVIVTPDGVVAKAVRQFIRDEHRPAQTNKPYKSRRSSLM